jgi:hypothetical protein
MNKSNNSNELLNVINQRRGMLLPVSSAGYSYQIAVIPPAPEDPRTIGVIVQDAQSWTFTTSDDLGAPTEPVGMLGHLVDCVACEMSQRLRER